MTWLTRADKLKQMNRYVGNVLKLARIWRDKIQV